MSVFTHGVNVKVRKHTLGLQSGVSCRSRPESVEEDLLLLHRKKAFLRGGRRHAAPSQPPGLFLGPVFPSCRD